MKIEMPNAPHRAVADTAEGRRLGEADTGISWRRFGPYLSDRQWGTVREDYSAGGDAWTYLPHDHARSQAYRWGEDAIAGFADDKLAICLGLALWNGHDPILKERLYGLTNSEGNHGEDVKELYYYLDGTPTHSYMRMLYKYPQAAFPYEDLRQTNARRGLNEREYELIDTGLFDDDRYFDVTVEYAKGAPDDILMLVTIANRGDAEAPLHVLPQLWSRNTWTWTGDASRRPRLAADGPRAVERDAPRPAGDAARVRRGAGAALLRQRDQRPPPLRPRRDGLVQGRHRRSSRRWRRGRSQSRARRHQGGRPLRAERAGARRGDAAPAAAPGRGGAKRRLRRFRRGLPGAARRVRRLLRRAAGGHRGRGRPPRAAPGLRRHALEQAILRVRHPHLARGRPGRARPAGLAAGGSRRGLDALLFRRHLLDAGCLGIPLVRGVGPRLPLRDLRADRPGLRQGAARASAAVTLPASERTDPRLRVELRRHQPAGARAGRDPDLRHRPRPLRPSRPHFSCAASTTSSRSTSPGGSTVRTRRTATSSRAAFSASTTSPCSTAPAPCPRAATSTRPTAPPGPRSTR